MSNTEILEKEYVAELTAKGFKEETEINLSNGEYNIIMGGYQFEIKNLDDKPSGYSIITTMGVKGFNIPGKVSIKDKKITSAVDGKVYKILYKLPDPISPMANPEDFTCKCHCKRKQRGGTRKQKNRRKRNRKSRNRA